MNNSKKLSVSANLANAFAKAGSDLGGSNLAILKLSKSGQWIFGAENTPVSDLRFAINLHDARRGFICFAGGEVVDEVSVPVALGKVILEDDLPYHGPYEGKDGWSACASIQMRSIETGGEYLFNPTSHGGLSAIGELLKEYSYHLKTGNAGIPIVDLCVTSYEHKRYGTVFKPGFKVVSWQNEDALMTKYDEESGDEPLDDDIPF